MKKIPFTQSLLKRNSPVVKLHPSFILAVANTKNFKSLEEEILKIDLISQVVQVEGMYDLVIKIESDSIHEIKCVVAKIQNIKSVRTCLLLFGIESNYLKNKGDENNHE